MHSETQPTYILQPDADLLSVTFRGDSDAAYTELAGLADLVGVDIARLHAADRRQGILQFTADNVPDGHVRAMFHPLYAQYFASGSAVLNYRTESDKLLELLVAVGATIRGKVIGVVGAHGGVGVTQLAAWIASSLARGDETVALIDCDPASPGVELLLSLVGVPGKRWADVRGKGALLAGRLNAALPKWKGVRVLSADERGGAPIDAGLVTAAVAALAQVNTWTILDLPTLALINAAPMSALVQWCDYLLVLTRGDGLHLAGTHTFLGGVAHSVPMSVVAMGVSAKNQAAHIAQMLAQPGVLTVHADPGAQASIEHGVTPGDRHRSKYAQDVTRICNYLAQKVQ